MPPLFCFVQRWLNTAPHNTSLLYSEFRYKGAWKDNMRSGRGVCKFADDSRYSGQWEHDTFNGRGECFGIVCLLCKGR